MLSQKESFPKIQEIGIFGAAIPLEIMPVFLERGCCRAA
jgi:hypothetical protein